MNIAFYAPLKPPDHPNPSGDRRLARLFVDALRMADHRVTLASRFRTWDGLGNVQRQMRLARIGKRIAARLVRRIEQLPRQEVPDIWFTYHLYHKAPDWLGPYVTAVVGIPYVIAEASFAPKQAGGPWDTGHRAVKDALSRADAVLLLNPDDAECLARLLPEGQRLAQFPPFLDVDGFLHGSPSDRPSARLGMGLPLDEICLVAVGMMRVGDKLDSYRLLGEGLRKVLNLPWRLLVVGDGVARRQVEEALAPLGAERVRFLGRLGGIRLAEVLRASDIMVWPAINEAFGMALLEGQAASLPVVAGDSRGVRAVVSHGRTGLLTAPGNAAQFADAVRALIEDPVRRRALGEAAHAQVVARHDLKRASRSLDRILVQIAHQARG